MGGKVDTTNKVSKMRSMSDPEVDKGENTLILIATIILI